MLSSVPASRVPGTSAISAGTSVICNCFHYKYKHELIYNLVQFYMLCKFDTGVLKACQFARYWKYQKNRASLKIPSRRQPGRQYLANQRTFEFIVLLKITYPIMQIVSMYRILYILQYSPVLCDLICRSAGNAAAPLKLLFIYYRTHIPTQNCGLEYESYNIYNPKLSLVLK